MVEIVVAAVPLLLLLAALLLGRYPGLEAAVRLSARIAAASRQEPAQRRQAMPRRAPRRAANGGLLLAFSLSGRAPPS